MTDVKKSKITTDKGHYKNPTVCTNAHAVNEEIDQWHKKIKFSCCKMWCKMFTCIPLKKSCQLFKYACCLVFCCKKRKLKPVNNYDLLLKKGIERIQKDFDMLELIQNVRHLMTIAQS